MSTMSVFFYGFAIGYAVLVVLRMANGEPTDHVAEMGMMLLILAKLWERNDA